MAYLQIGDMNAHRLLKISTVILLSSMFDVGKYAEAQSVDKSNSDRIKNRIEQSFTIEKTRKDIRIVGDGTIAKPHIDLKDEIIRLPASPTANAQKNEANHRIDEIGQMEERHYKKPLILSAGTFQSGDKLVRIVNIIPTNADKMCQSIKGKWPCGNFARAALRRLVRGNTINCASPDGLKVRGKFTVEESCEVSNFEIGKWLVMQGWVDSDYADFIELRDVTKANSLGIWRE